MKVNNYPAPTLRCKLSNLYIVGDSHTLIFKNKYFKDPYTGENYLINQAYIPGFNSENISQKGKLHTSLVDFLTINRLMTDDLKSKWNIVDQENVWESSFENNAQYPPPLIISCGELTLRDKILENIFNFYEFDSSTGEIMHKKDHFFTEFNDFCESFFHYFDNIIETLIKIRKAGLVNLSMLALPIPTQNSLSSNKRTKTRDLLEIKIRVTQKVNKYLSKRCSKEQIGFIDIGNKYEDSQKWSSKYHCDGVHLSSIAAPEIINEFLVHYHNNNMRFSNYERYKTLKIIVQNSNQEINFISKYKKYRQEFIKQGITIIDITSLKDSKNLFYDLALNFKANHNLNNINCSREWTGNTLENLSEMKRMVPTKEYIEKTYELIFETSLCQIIENCLGYSFSVYNLRPLESPPNHKGDIDGNWHYDGCPDGVYRMIIYLNDVISKDHFPFEYKDLHSKKTKRVIGNSGTAFLFDADKLFHRRACHGNVTRKVLDFVIVPRVNSENPILISSGMNNWPIDPFYVNLDKHLYYTRKKLLSNLDYRSHLNNFLKIK